MWRNRSAVVRQATVHLLADRLHGRSRREPRRKAMIADQRPEGTHPRPSGIRSPGGINCRATVFRLPLQLPTFMRSPFPRRFNVARRVTRLQRRLARCRRGVVVGFLLGCYAVALFGVPMPARFVATEASNQPYPCQDGTCGCNSAEQCWRSCCCYTDQQKFVWAKQNGVTPPADFLARFTPRELVETAAPRRSCCASKSPELGDRSPVAAGACDLAEPAKKTQGSCETAHDQNRTEAPSRFVITIEALKCRGAATDWIGLKQFLPAFRPEAPQYRPLIAQADLPRWDGLPEISFPPPSPPPRGPFSRI